MAVVDAYQNSDTASGKKAPAHNAQGSKVFSLFQTFECAAADDNGSKYRVFKGLPANLIPVRIVVMCDAITGFSDANVGLYKTDLGAVVLDNCLSDALDLSSASKILDGLKDVVIENRGKRLWELAGHSESNKLSSYDLVITAIAAASTAGTVSVIAEFSQPEG